MYVTDIEITEIPNRQGFPATQSSVVFMSYERQIQVLCDLRGTEQTNPFKRRIAFMRDALRQLRRMPEFRAGRDELTFEAGLLPDGDI